MHKVRYGLFYDNHTHLDVPDVGREFDAERFTDELLACGVDYLTFHARCNGGFAYYDTALGIRHPGLDYDLFGELARCCRKKKIALVAYFNGGISTQEAIENPQWRTIHMPGHNKFGSVNPFSITMCYNSPYRAHLISMIREVAEKYPVDGFFLDCLAAFPCVCPRCVKLMKEQYSLDCTREKDVINFARMSVQSICSDIKKEVHRLLPDPMLFFNINHGRGKDLDTFFDVECVTSVGRGHEYLPLLSHIVRNVKEGMQVLNMPLRFHNWADFGSLRSAAGIEYDLFYGLAQGMRPNLGAHLHPRGNGEEAPLRHVRNIYNRIQQFDSFYENAVTLTDCAIAYPGEDDNLRVLNSMFSSVRVLDELKVQFDILLADCEKSWDKYKLLILPEGVEVTPGLRQRIERHVARSGAFFACGQNAAEALGDLLGITPCGKLEMDPVYFRMREEYAQNMDDMYLSAYAPAYRAESAGAEISAYVVKPYYSKGWNGSNAIYYTPPEAETPYPFLTRKGKCVWCSADLFNGYAHRGALHIRQLIRNIVFDLLEKPLLNYQKLPGVLRAFVTEQPGRLNVHLLSYHGEQRGAEVCMEEALTFCDLDFSLFTGSGKVASVRSVSTGKSLSYTMEQAYTHIHLEHLHGYDVITVELEK